MDGLTGAELRSSGEHSWPAFVAALVGRAAPAALRRDHGLHAAAAKSTTGCSAGCAWPSAARRARPRPSATGRASCTPPASCTRAARQTGVFLQITCRRPTSTSTSRARKFRFSVLKQAQALGDLQALQSRKRPVVSVHLEDDIDRGLRDLVSAVETEPGAEDGGGRTNGAHRDGRPRAHGREHDAAPAPRRPRRRRLRPQPGAGPSTWPQRARPRRRALEDLVAKLAAAARTSG